MPISITFPRIIFAWILLGKWQLSHSCETKHINNAVSEYRCVPGSNNDADIWKLHLPQCVWKCLSMSTCRYVNHNQTAVQCVLGLGVCHNLEPAPGILIKGFGPARGICLSWGSPDEPGRVPIQENDGILIIYVSRLRTSNALIPGKYVLRDNDFWCNNEGDRTGPIYGLEEIEILTTDPACNLPWMPYTSGAQLPSGAVIGGHHADGTNLYVAWVDDGTRQSAFGYYNPSSETAYYEIGGAWTTRTMQLLILL